MISWDTSDLASALSNSTMVAGMVKLGIKGGELSGTSIVASALQKNLDETYVQGFSFYSLNGQTTPLNNGQSQAYVKNLSVTTLGGGGSVIAANNVQTSVEQATLNTGFTGSALANVFGTLELLKICGIGKSKKLTFISTTGCNNSFDNNGESKISFSTHSNYFDHLGGYIQSKLVAEQMLIRARNISYKTQILRVGQVGPNSKTKDLVVKDNHVSSLVNMVMGKNIYPNWNNYFECLPADIVSNVIYKPEFDIMFKIKYTSTKKYFRDGSRNYFLFYQTVP